MPPQAIELARGGHMLDGAELRRAEEFLQDLEKNLASPLTDTVPSPLFPPPPAKNRDPNGRTTIPSPTTKLFLPGSAQNVECDVTHSKQMVGEFLPGARIGQTRPRISIAKPLSNRELRLLESSLTHRKQTVASRSNRELQTKPCCANPHIPIRRAPFLTGSAPHSKFDVTHSKQSTEKILTGARTHIKISIAPLYSSSAHLSSSLPSRLPKS